MDEIQLKSLLKEADEAIAPAALDAPDAAMCLRIATNRKRTRRTVTAAAVCLVLAAAASIYVRGDGGRPIAETNAHTSQEPPESLTEEEIAALRQEAESYAQLAAQHEDVVALLRQTERLAALERELAELEESMAGRLPASVRVQEELYRLAATQLVVANRLATEYEDTELAADTYRLVIDQFPNTPWAAAARDARVRLGSQM